MTKKQLDILQAARAWRDKDRQFDALCRRQMATDLTLTERQDAAQAHSRQIEAIKNQRSEALIKLASAVDASEADATPEGSES